MSTQTTQDQKFYLASFGTGYNSVEIGEYDERFGGLGQRRVSIYVSQKWGNKDWIVEVNWSALGASSPEAAAWYADMIATAAKIATELGDLLSEESADVEPMAIATLIKHDIKNARQD